VRPDANKAVFGRILQANGALNRVIGESGNPVIGKSTTEMQDRGFNDPMIR
jgi:hypothetical protein